MTTDVVTTKAFNVLMSGDFLNGNTTRAFLAEVAKETIGPSGIAMKHLMMGQATWAPLSQNTSKRKGHRRVFVQSGRVQSAIGRSIAGGKLLSWGSSADIYSTGYKPVRYTGNGIYVSAKADKKTAHLTIGFSGRYKHSAGFNRMRREMASEKAGKKVDYKTARKMVSVGDVERRLKTINADRAARGLKRINKTAAMGSQGISGGKHVLSRGKDNLAYADIVQRGKFRGMRGQVQQNLFGGVVKRIGRSDNLVSAKGLSSLMRSGKHVKGKAEYGIARPLLPYRSADQTRIIGALNRTMEELTRNFK